MTQAPRRHVPTRVLYTALFGGYESLNELEVIDPAVRAICFTDDPTLSSSTWEIVSVTPVFPSDPIRSQRRIKIVGHEALKEYEEWLYIDNTVRLLATASEILNSVLADHDLGIPRHSFRALLSDEFDEVRNHDVDSFERVTEQLTHYAATYPFVLTQKPLWNGIIARRNTPQIAHWAELWWSHVQRYSRRDQLSVLVAIHLANVSLNHIDIDNYASAFHQWPILTNRKFIARFTQMPSLPQLALILRLRLKRLKNSARSTRIRG